MSVQSSNIPPFTAPRGEDALQITLRAATRRIRLLRLLRSESSALCYGALACLILVGASKVWPNLALAPGAVVGLIALALFLGALHALLPRLSELDVARLTEDRADLKERLSSAVEFQRQGVAPDQPFYGEQFTDANLHAAQIDLKRLYPARAPRQMFLGLVLCLALFLVYLLPNLPAFWSPQKRAEMAEVKAQGIQLLKVAEDKEKTADQQKLDETKKAAVEARKLAEAMKHNRMDKKEALVSMQKLTQKMEEQQRKLADQQHPKSMDQAGKEFKRSMDQMQKDLDRSRKERESQEAQKQLAKNLQKPGEKPNAEQQKQSEAMKMAEKALQQMQQAMANQDMQKMQQAMQQMAKAMQQGSMTKQEMMRMQQAMQQLSQALMNTQMNMSAQQLQQLSQMMQSMQSMDAKSMQQLAAMMKQIAGQMGKMPGNMGMQLMDAKELAALMQAMKDGRMTMAMGNGNRPGFGGKGPGKGFGGQGGPTNPMKDIDNTKPRLMVNNEKGFTKATGKSGSVKDLVKYLSMSSAPSKHLPNGKVNGSKTQQGQELSIQMTGDPDPAQSNSPYYKAVETSRRQAESTLDKENIPAAMKKQVRDYFDSIKP